MNNYVTPTALNISVLCLCSVHYILNILLKKTYISCVYVRPKLVITMGNLSIKFNVSCHQHRQAHNKHVFAANI